MNRRRLIGGTALLTIDLAIWISLRLTDTRLPGRFWLREWRAVIEGGAFAGVVLGLSLVISGGIRSLWLGIWRAPGPMRSARRAVLLLWSVCGALLLSLSGLLQLLGLAVAIKLGPMPVLHLPDPAPYEHAVLDGIDLYVMPAGGPWERVGSGYADGVGPPEVRRASDSPRYVLVVDGEVRVWIDLTEQFIEDREDQMPAIEELRREFGDDLAFPVR